MKLYAFNDIKYNKRRKMGVVVQNGVEEENGGKAKK